MVRKGALQALQQTRTIPASIADLVMQLAAQLSHQPAAGVPHLELSVPATINGHLRDYQRAGVRWFFRQYSQGQGGVLGDDMVRLSRLTVCWDAAVSW